MPTPRLSFFTRVSRTVRQRTAQALHSLATSIHWKNSPKLPRNARKAGATAAPTTRRKGKRRKGKRRAKSVASAAASETTEGEGERAPARARARGRPRFARRRIRPSNAGILGRGQTPLAAPAARIPPLEASQRDMRTAWGRTQSVAEWAGEWTLPVRVLWERLQRGLCLEEALTGEPVRRNKVGGQKPLTINGQTRPLRDWALDAGLSPDTLGKRLSSGMSPEEAVSAPLAKTNRPRDLRYAIRAGLPGSWSWFDLPYERDAYAQEFVVLHPDGAALEEVGAAMGVEVSWVCDIEKSALRKIRALLDDGEITERELIAALDTLSDHAPEGFDGVPVKAEPHEWEPSDDKPQIDRRRGQRDEPRIERWQDVPECPEDDERDDDDQGDDDHGDGAKLHPWRNADRRPAARRNARQIREWAAQGEAERLHAAAFDLE